jgi:hypothetical protein
MKSTDDWIASIQHSDARSPRRLLTADLAGTLAGPAEFKTPVECWHCFT